MSIKRDVSRKIIVMEDGKKIYEGEDKRHYNQDYVKAAAFGLTFADWMKMAVYIVGVIVFLVKADQRLQTLEENQRTLTQVSKSFQAFMDNSDGWHSAVARTQFKNGKPLNDGFHFAHNNTDKAVTYEN